MKEEMAEKNSARFSRETPGETIYRGEEFELLQPNTESTYG